MGVGIWTDPAGSRKRAEKTTPVSLPAAGGGVETFYQMTGPPLAWDYPTEEAVRIQRERDQAGDGSLEQLIRTKEAELEGLKQRKAERERRDAERAAKAGKK